MRTSQYVLIAIVVQAILFEACALLFHFPTITDNIKQLRQSSIYAEIGLHVFFGFLVIHFYGGYVKKVFRG